MTNIKKQITGIKISQFLKANKFVLFFHYNSKTIHKLYAIKEKMSIGTFSAGSTPPLRAKISPKRELHLQSANQENWSVRPLHQINSLLVKNKIALRVLDLHNVTRKHESTGSLHLEDNLAHIKTRDPSKAPGYIKGLRSKLIGTKVPKGTLVPHEQKDKNSKVVQKKNTAFIPHKKKQLNQKPLPLARESLAAASLSSSLISRVDRPIEQVSPRQLSALFQGPAVLLGFNNINYFEKILNIYKQEKDFILFGGIYNNDTLLNQADIKKMGQLIKDDFNAIGAIKELQKPTLSALITLKKVLYFHSFLKDPTLNLLRMLEFRNYQLSNREF